MFMITQCGDLVYRLHTGTGETWYIYTFSNEWVKIREAQ